MGTRSAREIRESPRRLRRLISCAGSLLVGEGAELQCGLHQCAPGRAAYPTNCIPRGTGWQACLEPFQSAPTGATRWPAQVPVYSDRTAADEDRDFRHDRYPRNSLGDFAMWSTYHGGRSWHAGAFALKVAFHCSRVSKSWFELSLFGDATSCVFVRRAS